MPPSEVTKTLIEELRANMGAADDATDKHNGDEALEEPSPGARAERKMELSPSSRERIVAFANLLDALAANLFGSGVLATIIAYAFSDTISDDKAFWAVVLTVLCIFGSIGLHILAQKHRLELDTE